MKRRNAYFGFGFWNSNYDNRIDYNGTDNDKNDISANDDVVA